MTVTSQYSHTVLQDHACALLGDVHFHSPSDFGKETKCQHLLKTSNYEAHQENVPDKHPQTCRWILDDPLFQQWHRGGGPTILWVSANPGCGKTVFAKSLMDSDRSDGHETAICYFFFKRGEQERENLANALCAILHQLFRSRPNLLRHAVAEWEQVGARLSTEPYALWRVLRHIDDDTEAGTVTCILDALDECQHQDRKRLVEWLAKLAVDAQRQGRGGNIKFLVTSRPDTEVEMQFRPRVNTTSVAWLCGEHEDEKLRQDVDIVVTDDVNCWSTEFDLSDNHKELLLCRLHQFEQRTYLWWALVRDIIHATYDAESDSNDVDVDNLIHTLRSSLDDVYEDMFQRLNKLAACKAREIFPIMLAARRPLTVAESARLSSILRSLNRAGFPRIQEDELKLRPFLRKWCGSFVSVYQSKLHFFHPTARDFLSRVLSQDERVEASVQARLTTLDNAHETLAIASYAELQWCKDTSLRLSIPPGPKENSTRIDQPFFDYAAVYAVYHARKTLRSGNQDNVTGVLTRFNGLGMNLETVDNEGRSLLHHLILYEYSDNVRDMIEKVLQAGGLVTTADCDNMHVLQHAVRRGNAGIVSSLLKHKFPVNRPVKRKTIHQQHADTKFSRPFARHNSLKSINLTAVHAAVLYGRPEELRLLLGAGADLRAHDSHGGTVLHAALTLSLPGKRLRDSWEIDEQMLGYVDDYGDEEATDNTLVEADEVRRGILRSLCERDPPLVNCRDERGQTALHVMHYNDRNYDARKVVDLLLQAGANPTTRDEAGVTAVHLAAESGHMNCLEFLVAAVDTNIFAAVDEHGRNCLHYAAKAPDQRAVEYILAKPIGSTLVNTVDFRGQSPLHISLFDAVHPHLDRLARSGTVETLLRAGAKADLTTCDGRDALAHYLVAKPFLLDHEIVRMLLRYGANAEFKEDGSNLAHILVRGWNEVSIEALHVLRNHEVSLDATDSHGRSILHCAAIAGTVSDELIVYLRGMIDPLAEDRYGKTALMYAQEKAREERNPNFYRSDRWKTAVACLNGIGERPISTLREA